MIVSAATKYIVIAVLDGVIALATYVTSNPVLTESTVLGGVVLIAGLAVHDIESGTPESS
jgi:hypothetical protein